METTLNLKTQRMTSLEIAEVTGKPHNDVLKAIRKMEPAWVKVNQGNFSLVNYKDAKGELRPCFFLVLLWSFLVISGRSEMAIFFYCGVQNLPYLCLGISSMTGLNKHPVD